MNAIPIVFFFRRTSMSPLLEGIGECSDKNAEPVMLGKALEFIKMAEKFKGLPYLDFVPNYNSKTALCVSFALIFPSEEKLQNFVQFVQSNHC